MASGARRCRVAVLTVTLLVGFAVIPAVAQAEIYLVSPTTVEAPATIVLAAPEPNMDIFCYQGIPDPENNWEPAPSTEIGACGLYFAKRFGPYGDGLYYFRWKLPMSQPGPTVLKEVKTWTDDPNQIAEVGNFTFTVTANRLRYGDFQSCLDFRIQKALIAFYSRITTEIVFQAEYKVRRKQPPRQWVWRSWRRKRQLLEVGPFSGNAPYERHFVRFRVPNALVRNVHNGNLERAKFNRAHYVVKQGKKILAKGWVSKRICEENPSNSPVVALPE